MRIIAGKYKTRKLVDTKRFKDLRPTTDTNRENLFNILSSSKAIKNTGFELQNCDLLDVFCGTGAISLEAISRGVKSATLIDNSQKHLAVAQENASLLKETSLEYFYFDLSKPVRKSLKQYNLIFIDPPYSKNLAAIAVANLLDSNWISSKALIIIEHSRAEDLQPLEARLSLLEQRKYGETIFSFFS